MARVKVTEPVSGVEFEVEDDSPQALAWGGSKGRKANQGGTDKPVTRSSTKK